GRVPRFDGQEIVRIRIAGPVPDVALDPAPVHVVGKGGFQFELRLEAHADLGPHAGHEARRVLLLLELEAGGHRPRERRPLRDGIREVLSLVVVRDDGDSAGVAKARTPPVTAPQPGIPGTRAVYPAASSIAFAAAMSYVRLRLGSAEALYHHSGVIGDIKVSPRTPLLL